MVCNLSKMRNMLEREIFLICRTKEVGSTKKSVKRQFSLLLNGQPFLHPDISMTTDSI